MPKLRVAVPQNPEIASMPGAIEKSSSGSESILGQDFDDLRPGRTRMRPLEPRDCSSDSSALTKYRSRPDKSVAGQIRFGKPNLAPIYNQA